MICLNTKDNWALAQVTVTVSGTPHNWACPSNILCASEAIYDFTNWFDGAFYPKNATPNFDRNATDGGIKLTVAFTTSWGGSPQTVTIAPNATATALLGFVTATGNTLTAASSAAGTWAPAQAGGLITYGLDYPMLEGTGDAAGAGAIRSGVPGLANCKPVVEAVCNPTDAARLASVLARLPTYRRGLIYKPLDQTWHYLSFGAVSRANAGHTLYKFSFDVSR